MSEPIQLLDHQRLAYKALRERLWRAEHSAFNQPGAMPFLEGEVSEYSVELMDALGKDWWESQLPALIKEADEAGKHELAKRLRESKQAISKEHPVISDRQARKKSQEDRSPHLRMHPIAKLDIDGQPAMDREGNPKAWDPFDQAAFNQFWDETTETLPGSEDGHYSVGHLGHLARSAVYRRSRVSSGKALPGGDYHVELIDVEQRSTLKDPIGVQLAAMIYARPRSRLTRKEEAAALGISERTHRRRRAAMQEQEAA